MIPYASELGPRSELRRWQLTATLPDLSEEDLLALAEWREADESALLFSAEKNDRSGSLISALLFKVTMAALMGLFVMTLLFILGGLGVATLATTAN